MATVKLLIHLPPHLKPKLDALRREGYSTSGYVRRLVEHDLQAREEAGWRPGQGWEKKAGRKSARR